MEGVCDKPCGLVWWLGLPNYHSRSTAELARIFPTQFYLVIGSETDIIQT